MPANASISYSSSRFADIIGACLMVVSHVAHGAPPPDADVRLAPWFHSLTIPNTGSSCCGAADCRNCPVVVASDGYRVQFKGQWLKVPPAVVQDRGDNPTGDYVTCIIDAVEPELLCFEQLAIPVRVDPRADRVDRGEPGVPRRRRGLWPTGA